jgi:prepilin-type N-terminal cleavage/methylation domain-containing protein
MRRRKGFTITELLVAMALIVFIMYILAEAFSAGSSAFRNLKAIGDMNEKLRGTSQTLRRFLQADHFEDKRRVSDPDFWKDGPPRAGFLRIYNGSPASTTPTQPYYYEGVDLDGNVSYRAVDHGLHFAVKLRGNNRGDYFRASLPAGSPLLLLPLQDTRFQETPGTTLNSSWGEVAVFMVKSGDQTEDVEGTTAPQDLYVLYLRQRALVPDNQLLTDLLFNTTGRIPGSSYQQYVEMSCHKDPTGPADPNSVLYFNGPADMTMPARRMGGTPGSASDTQGSTPPSLYPTLANEPGGLLAGNDVLMTNVLSFDVRVLLDRNQWFTYYADVGQTPQFYDFVTLDHPAIQWFSQGNPTFSAPNVPRVFDTWSQSKDDAFDYGTWATPGLATSIPLYQNNSKAKATTPVMQIRLVAIQITMRIWDANTKQTRQTSIVVDL